MDIPLLLKALAMVAFASIVIMYLCESFDSAAGYLGRNMAPGIKGATINAVGSSMPELLTTMAFLFLYRDVAGFSAGVATAAGSAVFNGLIIPAVCILVVAMKGVQQKDGSYKVIDHFSIGRHTILRDGFWLIVGELLLIYFLGDTTLTWVTGASLLMIYVGYFIHLMIDNKRHAVESVESDEDDDEDDEEKSFIKALFTLDFHHILFSNRPFNDFRAWVVLVFATLGLSLACWALAEAVIMAAKALNIPAYFTAVVLAAAATSVPDTILSLQDAKKGDYDDAVSNALGSNIFDIAVSLGLPLFLYSLFFGAVELKHATGESAADVQELRIILLGVTVVLAITLFLRATKITKSVGWFLLALYGVWMGWIVWSVLGRTAT